MKIVLKVAYRGTSYAGFQFQPGSETIQGVLTSAAEKVFGLPVNVTGCSRTDAGVHARGFVASVEAKEENRRADWLTIPVEKIHRVFRLVLPPDVAVLGAAEVPEDFHPRYGVTAKRYVYRIWDRPQADPFLNGLVYMYQRPLNEKALETMRQTAALWVGRHDFAAYMATGSKIQQTERTVYETSVSRDADGCVCFSVTADGFLYHMVRIMTGTLLDAVNGKIQEEDILQALRTGDRTHSGFTAPPEGLYLEEVFYPENWEWKAQ